MRVANVAGRCNIVLDGLAYDVERASGGRFGADPQAAFERWDELNGWASGVEWASAPPIEPRALELGDLGAPAPRPSPADSASPRPLPTDTPGGSPAPVETPEGTPQPAEPPRGAPGPAAPVPDGTPTTAPPAPPQKTGTDPLEPPADGAAPPPRTEPTPNAGETPRITPAPGVTSVAPMPERPRPTADEELTERSRGRVSAPGEARRGGELMVTLGSSYADATVLAWLHSTPALLGSPLVSAAGTITVTIPADAALGDHRIVVQTAEGSLIGWAPVRVIAADAVGTPSAATGSGGQGLAATGGDVALPLAAAAGLLLLGGLAVVGSRGARRGRSPR